MNNQTTTLPDNPYIGPRTYKEDERDRFFGRDREARELLALVQSERLVLFYAASGAGKSSLLVTQLVPMLRDLEHFEILPIGRVSGDLPASITKDAVKNIYMFNLIARLNSLLDVAEQHALTHLAQMHLAVFLGAEEADLVRSAPSTPQTTYETQPTVLIIDQFEEIITTNPEQWEKRTDFFDQLRVTQQIFPNLWILLSMREDYVAALDPYVPLLSNRLRARLYLRRLEAEAALQAVKGPAELWRHPFEVDVAEKLVDDLRQIRVHGQAETATGQFIEPVQLQVVCYQVWESIKHKPLDAKITFDDLKKTDVDTALTKFYEEALAAVLAATPTQEHILRRWFSKELITMASTRGTIYQTPDIITEDGEKKEGKTGSLFNSAVSQLENRYIVRSEIRAGSRWYELVHDRLVQPILTANRQWQDKWLQENRIMSAAKEWESTNKSKQKLLSGKVLEDALTLFDLTDVDPLIATFLKASQETIATVPVWERANLNQTLPAKQTWIDPNITKELSEVGWGVIFPVDLEGKFVPAVKEALTELLTLRQAQAGERFRIFEREHAFRPGESALDFLVRHGTTIGAQDYNAVPFYLLLVGDPEQIPWRFQTDLALDFAVGRIHFDTIQEYANYTRSVTIVERMKASFPRHVAMFNPASPDDHVGAIIMKYLTEPLLQWLQTTKPEWQINKHFKENATKAQLSKLLGGDQTPTILWAATRGMEFPKDHSRQVTQQGALLCQDWPGPEAWREVLSEEFYFTGDNLQSDANLLGTIAYFVNPYGIGTPMYDEFSTLDNTPPRQIAPRPFVARLPMRMLGHERGGALAVIGQIGNLWTDSFRWGDRINRLEQHHSFLDRILNGDPVGVAMQAHRHNYTSWGALFANLMYDIKLGIQVEPYEVHRIWRIFGTARNQCIIGDPAVRLWVGEGLPEISERPTILESTFESFSQPTKIATLETTELLYFNGINAETGEYDLAPMTPERLFDILRGVAEPETIKELKYRGEGDAATHF